MLRSDAEGVYKQQEEDMDTGLLSVAHLSKRYKSFALQDISFELPAGYIMGYVGRNGAGKTTTLNAVTRLITPDSGEVKIDGRSFEEDPVRFRESIGYIGDSAYFPQGFTAKDVSLILADFYPSFRREQYESFLQKWDIPAQKKVREFSRGMKVKLMFASVLSRDTKLLILDEATNGLDPVVRREVLKLLQEYIESGTRSVLFSTHILEDLQDIADYIFLIDHGKMVFHDSKEGLLEKYLLVKGGPSDLTEELSEHLTGLEKGAYGFSALFDTDQAFILPAALQAERPTIDEIVVRLLAE